MKKESLTTELDYELIRKIQKWSWRRGNRKKLLTGEFDFGTVAEAAKHFKLSAEYICQLIGTPHLGNCGPYFYWLGPDDDFSKMRFEHDGE